MTPSSSEYLFYELKDLSFLILERYGDTDTCRDNTSCHNLKPTAIYTDSEKGKKFFI